MKNKSEIIQEFIEKVLNGGDIEATGDYFCDDVVEEVPFPGQGPGLTGLKAVLAGLRSAFPDMRWIVHEQIESENKVATRFSWSGTHRGEFLSVGATGRQVTVWGVVIDQFAGQKVKSTRIIMDLLGLMAQLGVLQNASPGARANQHRAARVKPISR
jgi:steroid delta-isomerase-like uncharacterized protein